MKIQFIGIGGVGVSALAKWLFKDGHNISGINDSESKETLDELRRCGVNIKIGTTVDLLDKNADMYIYSVAWLQRAPELMQNVIESNKAKSYFEALGYFSKDRKVIAIAGTHGKTTTVAMVHDILSAHNFNHDTIVGSILKKGGSNFVPAKEQSDWLLVEACEYKRHFLNFNPEILAITNIEAEHLDYYKDLQDVQNAFAELASQTKSAVILNKNDKNIQPILNTNVNISDWSRSIQSIGELPIPGKHNLHNAATAFAVAEAVLKEKFNPDIANKALLEFKGTWRRFEKLGHLASGALLISDYAHHPSEIKATIEAANSILNGSGKVFVIFEPHTYSRLNALIDEFANSFMLAHKVFVTEIYAAREENIFNVTEYDLMDKINHISGNAEVVNYSKVFEKALNESNGNDIILALGAGNIHEIASEFLSKHSI